MAQARPIIGQYHVVPDAVSDRRKYIPTRAVVRKGVSIVFGDATPDHELFEVMLYDDAEAPIELRRKIASEFVSRRKYAARRKTPRASNPPPLDEG
jgi:hypothetical protein